MPRKLIERVPRYYQNSRVMAHLFASDEGALARAEELIESIDRQCLISTADTSLFRWEHIYGVPTIQESNERRRERVLARKRGYGTVTPGLLKDVISSFSNGAVEVVEHYSDYLITITFTDQYGVPPFIEDVKNAVEDIIPAHLNYAIIILYHTWSDIGGYRWEEMAGKTWKQIAEEDI